MEVLYIRNKNSEFGLKTPSFVLFGALSLWGLKPSIIETDFDPWFLRVINLLSNLPVFRGFLPSVRESKA